MTYKKICISSGHSAKVRGASGYIDEVDEARLVVHPGGGWTVWYGRGGTTVGVLTHECDEDYEHGRGLVERARPLP